MVRAFLAEIYRRDRVLALTGWAHLALLVVMLCVNTVLAFLLLVLFFLQTVPLSPAYLWALRIGMLVFVLGSLEGLVMIFQQAHTVGAPDGGPGLPLVNWSTRAGDLRVAHLLGLHSIQILPLAGFAIARYGKNLRAAGQLACVFAFAFLYVGLAMTLFWQAMSGRPLMGT